MSSAQLSDHAKKALETPVANALSLIKKAPQTNLHEWRAAVTTVLTAVGGITGGDKYAAVASIARHATTGGDRPRLHMREAGRETAGSLEFRLEMDVGEVRDPQAARPRRRGVCRRGHRSGGQACTG